MELQLSVQKLLIDHLGKAGTSGQIEDTKPSGVCEGEFTTKHLSFLSS